MSIQLSLDFLNLRYFSLTLFAYDDMKLIPLGLSPLPRLLIIFYAYQKRIFVFGLLTFLFSMIGIRDCIIEEWATES